MAALVLNLLGGFEVRLRGGPPLALSTKTGLALLAYLALTAGQRHSRDKLAALLWEDRPDQQARTSLRQTLAVLRKALQPFDASWLSADGDWIAIDRDVVDTDVANFERFAGLANAESLMQAAALYKGDLLDGFNLRSEGLADWLRTERERLRGRAVQVLGGLLVLQSEGKDIEVAIATANRLLSLDPLNEGAHRSLMRLYVAEGRQELALRQYEICRDRLRRELSVDPHPATTALHQEILARRSGTGPANTTAPSSPASKAAIAAQSDTHRPDRPSAGLSAMDTLLLPLPDKPSIAVLSFENMSGDPEQEYFADGIAEELITALSRMHWLFVIARNSSFTYKRRMVDVKQIGRELGVRYVLEGSVRKAGNRVRITGQLIDTSTGAHLWADRFDGELEDIFELQDQVTTSVVGAIAPKLVQAEIERAKRKPTESLDAYDYFLRGIARVHEWTREANYAALPLFYRAIELDPNFASAYGMAARCYSARKAARWVTDRKQEIAEAERLARRAAELGRDDAVALSTAGLVLGYVVGDLDDGAALTDRALVLNPNLAWAWLFSAWVSVLLGESEVAIERFARSMRLSPQDPQIFNMHSGTAAAHFFAGRYAEALSWAETAVREQPNYVIATAVAAASGALAGRLAEAEKAMARMRQLEPALHISDCTNLIPVQRSEHMAKWVEGPRKAGLPD